MAPIMPKPVPCLGGAQLRFVFSTVNSTRAIGADALGVTVVGRNIFWGDAAGVHRQAF